MSDVLTKFQISDWDQQLVMLRDTATADAVTKWIGEAAVAELKLLDDGTHLGGGKRNMIVVPGVMGSMLQSEGYAGVWWVDIPRALSQLNQLALDPDGTRDIDPLADVKPCAIDLTYAPLRQAVPRSGDFGGTVQFPYDWRKPLAASADDLRKLVEKTYEEAGEPVHLVGHSMGGLMIRVALMRHGDSMWSKVGKIVFVGTPHYGATAIAGYLKNHLWGWELMAVLGAYLSRETFRSLWGVLSLLPAPSGVYPGTRSGGPHPCANFDIYDAEAWKLGLTAPETLQLQRVLQAAEQQHRDLFNWHMGLSPSEWRRMLQISGVGLKSLFRLEVKPGWLGLWTDVDRITARKPGDPNRDGDGRVPLASAQLENVTHRYVRGAHGGLHNIPSVITDMLNWIAERDLGLPDNPQDALSSHLASTEPSVAPTLDGSGVRLPNDDSYDRYRDVPPETVNQLCKMAERGELQDLNLLRLL